MSSGQPAGAGTTEKYEVLCNIGRGSFGIISKVKRKTDNQVLCRKEIHYAKMQQKERDQLQTEVSILKSLRHPNIVSYFETVHIPSTQDLHLYMEYCGGGDLGKVIRDLALRKDSAEESYVWTIVSQLVSALYRCHYGIDPPPVPKDILEKPKGMGLRSKSDLTILHRDLKPENIFLSDEWSVKLGDFGLSKQIQGGGFANTYVGTPYYMSPEICNGERYTLKSDIWSMGCIIYELCTTVPPFDARTHVDLVAKIRRGTYEPISKDYSPSLHDLIKSCLQVNPHKRPATNELLDNPMVRMMRKEAAICDMEKRLRQKEDVAEQTRREAEEMMVRLNSDRQKLESKLESKLKSEKQGLEQEINERLRREWELRANLKIKEMVDTQVESERQRLHRQWEEEFPKRVATESDRRFQEYLAMHRNENAKQVVRTTSPVSPESAPYSSALSSQSMATDEFTTDLSSLSVAESPFRPLSKQKRASRTPFTRAKAQTAAVDSPMDVQMVSPSPLNSLSLSPRRNGNKDRLAEASRNLFAPERAQRWEPTSLSEVISDGEEADLGGLSESEDETMPLPSPTLTRKRDPFIAARTNNKRPSLGRQQTVPANRGLDQARKVPLLFNQNGAHGKEIEQGSNRSTSPTRERRTGGLKTARTDGDMLRDAVERNAQKQHGGRTLGELREGQLQNRGQHTIVHQQPLILSPKDTNIPMGSGKENASTGEPPKQDKVLATDFAHMRTEVAVWNPDEVDEMPSPFLCKTKGRGILPVR